MNLGLPESCRRFSLSPSGGEKAGVRGPSWGLGAQSASNGRGVLLTLPPTILGTRAAKTCSTSRVALSRQAVGCRSPPNIHIEVWATNAVTFTNAIWQVHQELFAPP